MSDVFKVGATIAAKNCNAVMIDPEVPLPCGVKQKPVWSRDAPCKSFFRDILHLNPPDK
jgi:hypothetical protein